MHAAPARFRRGRCIIGQLRMRRPVFPGALKDRRPLLAWRSRRGGNAVLVARAGSPTTQLCEVFMRVGVPKEIKNHEYRVGLTPPAVRELTAHGHEVFVETWAGDSHRPARRALCEGRRQDLAQRRRGVRRRRDDRQGQGAAAGRDRALREGQILFTYLHLAPDPEQTEALLKSRRCLPSPMKPSPTRAAACRCWRR